MQTRYDSTKEISVGTTAPKLQDIEIKHTVITTMENISKL